MEAGSFVTVPYTESLEDSIRLFVEQVRTEATGGPVRWRIALFVKDTHGWRTVVLDPGDTNDADAMLTWSMNRMARIIDASAAAYAEEWVDDGAVACIERRDAPALEVHRLGRGDADAVSAESDREFFFVPGGPPDVGWGRQDHDDIAIDYTLG